MLLFSRLFASSPLRLPGVMPEALSHLEYLTLLDLSNNEISGELPCP